MTLHAQITVFVIFRKGLISNAIVALGMRATSAKIVARITLVTKKRVILTNATRDVDAQIMGIVL